MAARLPSLTGLRFVAAAGVFVYHVQSLLPKWPPVAPGIAAGQAGVSFFFILSGFVLTWSSSSGEVCLATFWRRRAARILPSYLVSWALGIPITLAAFGAWPTPWALLSTATLTQSWVADKSVFFGVNGVAWTLSCEAVFYLLFPFLLRSVRRLAVRGCKVGIGVCVVALAAVQLTTAAAVGRSVDDPSTTAFWLVSVLPVSRLPEFVIGMLAACAFRQGARPVVQLRWALAAAAGALYVAGSLPAVVITGWLTALPFVVLICAAAQADLTGVHTGLAAGWLVRLGTWSFAFYLTHQLVLRLLDRAWPATSVPVVHAVTDLLAALAVSALLYRRVEAPAERMWRSPREARISPP